MAAGNTYESIATQTLGSAAASVTFSSIPSTYTDLVVVCSNVTASNGSANFFYLCGNGTIDTGSNYSVTVLGGNGSTASSARQSTQGKIIVGAYYVGISSSTSFPSQTIINVMNYANTTTYKTVLSRDAIAASGAGATEAFVGLWRSTSAIDTIQIKPDSGNFNTGTFSVYGIKAA